MPNLSVADDLYLIHKNLTASSTPIITEVPTDHIVVLDCSGSMTNELPQIRQQLKNKLAMMLKETDTVSIVWFSGRAQFGVVVEGVPLHSAVDLTGIHRAIDNFLKPVGLTGFVDPLEESAKLIERLRKPGHAINLFFMSDGHDNQWGKDKILQATERLQPIVSSAAVVEYGYYCNHPLMVQIAERLGATQVLAENFPQYEPIFETAMTKRSAGAKKIEVRLETAALHGFAFALTEGEVISYAVDGRMVLVPEGLTDLYWFAELPPSANFIPASRVSGEGLTPLYAGLVPLTQRMLSNDIFKVLKSLGDVRLIRQYNTCFGKQAYGEFQNTVTEAAFDATQRLVDGFNPDEVPPENAYTIIDLLYQLAGDDGNLFYPSHESFSYERIGRKAVQADRVLNDSEATRLGEIAAQLVATRDPKDVQRLQRELSELAETKPGLNFIADNPDAGYPVSSLVFNEDRPNISALVKIPGKLDLTIVPEDVPVGGWMKSFPFLFPTSIHRNYTIIRDGIRNVKVLPVSLTEETHRVLVRAGVLDSASWVADHIYEIDLMKIPLINRKMVKTVSAKDLFEKQFDLLKAKAAQKVFNYYYDDVAPSEATKGFTEVYGADVAAWLASHGIKDYGYSPKVELAEATESYYGKELAVSLAGLSSLPSVKSVLDKLASTKKLTTREAMLAPAIAEVQGFCRGLRPYRDEAFAVWLTNRKRDTISQVRKAMREIAANKFAVIVGQVWYSEFNGNLDENSLVMTFDGHDVKCTANLNEVEIKV